MKSLVKSRFCLLFAIIITYIGFSFLIRTALYFWSFSHLEFNILSLLKIYGLGLYFDLGVALFFSLPYLLYLLVIPSRFIGSNFDKTVTFIIVGIEFFIALFGLFGELPFWDEFSHRYNFIAVDYLIYTYEVVSNINESYPIPLILLVLLGILSIIFFAYRKFGVFSYTFNNKQKIRYRLGVGAGLASIVMVYIALVTNKQAEWSNNTYENELSKSGIFSLFAAYRSSELEFDEFYKTLPQEKAYSIVRNALKQSNQNYETASEDDLIRRVSNGSEITPNIILITVESLSADFLGIFGNEKRLTPNLDQLSKESLFFTNLFASGTRTARGMEALTLSVPPTPGNSIIRRPNNEHLFSIATILNQKNYNLSFIYGGDGYFDNMNYFFGNQGFDIIDRDRGNPLAENITTNRYHIPDNEVTFENAWGICDEDLYKQAIKQADLKSEDKKPFFQFIMTTSNHRPYSFPKDKIDLPQGHRDAAVKYTDYAIGKFIESCKQKSWFKNTVFVIIADHCASSAGKWELNIDKHHIPAFIYNLPNAQGSMDKLAAQIDVMPTLFGLLHWNYETELYGYDLSLVSPNEERAFIGNYRTLGLFKNNILTQLTDHKAVDQFSWNAKTQELTTLNQPVDSLKILAISYYQSASERFKNGSMKEKQSD